MKTIEKSNEFFLILAIFFLCLLFFGVLYSNKEIEVVRCVDGHGNVNLEGFGCEDEIFYFYKLEDRSFGNILFSINLIIIIILGMIYLLKTDGDFNNKKIIKEILRE